MYAMGEAAMIKFREIDVDNSGMLDKDEVLQLAEWTWSSFHEGAEPSAQEIQAEAGRLMQACDANNDGVIMDQEFETWYLETLEAIESNRKAADSEETPVAVVEEKQTDAKDETMEAAMKQFHEIDIDESGMLDGDEVLELAKWTWRSFHEGETPTEEVGEL